MPVINYHYLAFKFDRKLNNPLFEDEYSALKTNGQNYIEQMVKIKTGHLKPVRQIRETYFTKTRTTIYFSFLVIVILYSLFMLDIKADWNSYLGFIIMLMMLWLIIYTFQFGLSTFKTFDSLDDYKAEMKSYYEHHLKLVERTKSFPEYSLLVSQADIMAKARTFKI